MREVAAGSEGLVEWITVVPDAAAPCAVLHQAPLRLWAGSRKPLQRWLQGLGVLHVLACRFQWMRGQDLNL